MLRRHRTLGGLVLLAGLGIVAIALRGASPRAVLWRAHLVSLVADRDTDVRNNLLRDAGDPFALRRLLLSTPATGADAETWRAFTGLASAPRPDYEALDATAAALPAELPRGAEAAYRYLHLWSYWQRNRSGSASAGLAHLLGQHLPAARAAAALGRGAGERGEVQLAIPGLVRSAAAGGRLRYSLRRLQPLVTGRLAMEFELEMAAPVTARTEILACAAAGADFLAFALLPEGASEITTPQAVIGGPGPWLDAGRYRVRIVWDAAAEEATLLVEQGERPFVLRAAGAQALLEPAGEIELRFTALEGPRVSNVVVSAAAR